jgi:ubiquinone/menaquinone biosynthesis C-methylase UbiE
MSNDALPGYEPMLLAYHTAFARELKAMIDALPVRPGDRVIDLACGDGAYLPWLADRVGPTGRVVAVDVSPAYLERAQSEFGGGPVDFVAGVLERPPLPEASFDLVWCAQSLYSLSEPVESVRRMARIVKPGGTVAVLEGDSLHHLILPWPIEVELSVRAAELAALADESDHPRKFYVGRRLRTVFAEAGLVDIVKRTWASDRAAPLDEPTRRFLLESLRVLRERIASHLDCESLDAFDRVADEGSPEFLLDRPDFDATCIDHVVWGVRPYATARPARRS